MAVEVVNGGSGGDITITATNASASGSVVTIIFPGLKSTDTIKNLSLYAWCTYTINGDAYSALLYAGYENGEWVGRISFSSGGGSAHLYIGDNELTIDHVIGSITDLSFRSAYITI